MPSHTLSEQHVKKEDRSDDSILGGRNTTWVSQNLIPYAIVRQLTVLPAVLLHS